MVALMTSQTTSRTAAQAEAGEEPRRFTVTAERGTDPAVWVFQCREYPGAISQSRRLSDAARLMAEAIGFVAELEEAPEEIAARIDLVPVLPAGLEDDVRQARAAVADLEHRQRDAAVLSRQAARRLREAGLSGADTAVVLGVSPQRVSQLVRNADPA